MHAVNQPTKVTCKHLHDHSFSCLCQPSFRSSKSKGLNRRKPAATQSAALGKTLAEAPRMSELSRPQKEKGGYVTYSASLTVPTTADGQLVEPNPFTVRFVKGVSPTFRVAVLGRVIWDKTGNATGCQSYTCFLQLNKTHGGTKSRKNLWFCELAVNSSSNVDPLCTGWTSCEG